MTVSFLCRCAAVCLCVALNFPLVTSCLADRPLLRIDSALDPSVLKPHAVELSVEHQPDGSVLRMSAGHDYRWPGITITLEGDNRNLSKYGFVAVDVHNVGPKSVGFAVRVDSLDADLESDSLTENQTLAAGETRTVRAALRRKMPDHLKGRLMGMRSNPEGFSEDQGLDTDAIDKILLFVTKKDHEQTVEISSVRAEGDSKVATIWLDSNADPFPMIDLFGQYAHADWPGKTHSLAELKQNLILEEQDIDANPSPEHWDLYGGYVAGPELKATGHFRVQKYEGKWWLVDPEGRLFWSNGIDCVDTNSAQTPITDREFYFSDLPQRDSPMGGLYGRGNWAPHGYYKDRGRYETFNFTAANLVRKYGEDWRTLSRDLAHRRLRSWGLNTIANWSDENVYRMERTPYVVTCNSAGRRIEGSSGYWGKFPDPFDSEFAESVRRSMEYYRNAANSPWCIGVFVDNELAWGDELSLAKAALQSPSDQPAKQAFVDALKLKYARIENLNETWGTPFASWAALLEEPLNEQTMPDDAKAGDDLRAFYSQIGEQYFRVCRQAVKSAAPNTLYLGCRFAWVNDLAVRASAKHCDVIGFNRYEYSVADYQLPEGVDRPAIIGEFHFGALDRGLFHTGLKPTKNQQARADAYRDYLRGALQNPIWVGAHWFQYGDQAATGRGDGENYQIGFVDVCDTPYPETIQAARQIGDSMYQLRLEPVKMSSPIPAP
ncbi:beta-galactosidase [Novipirellula artificiosorum]|uniref:Glycoside hydrolase family 42 N-terminal domain-containing protein n=1 Tax=Novipirellula artificiosorum TaxID=2528016 RepID=A0A5C6DJ76_9BACT|nr:beta-galactosidase [Novipirellula artificiosorum]TWU36154.1 hypothetical protein Poly41_39070 [Novipirellula artificiosorum]